MVRSIRGIEHRLTRPNHPWSREDQKTVPGGTVFPRGGQVDRMNRTIEEATVKRFHYDSHDQLRTQLADFIDPPDAGTEHWCADRVMRFVRSCLAFPQLTQRFVSGSACRL